MAVDTKHPSYLKWADDWRRVRDVLGGQRAMRDISRDYLRRPQGMVDAGEWQRYVDGTTFFEATLRTQEGLTGLAFYRPPEVKMPDALKPFVDDATQDGVPLLQFLEGVFEEVNAIGRVGVLVDYPPKDEAIRNRLQDERSKRRPFVRRYDAENIIWWETGKVHGAVVLTQVRLSETETEKVDEFSSRHRKVIRVLDLIEKNPGAWVYRQRKFVHKEWLDDEGNSFEPIGEGAAVAPSDEKAEEWIEQLPAIEPVDPDGKPFDFIPFWFINPTDHSVDVKRPPLLGLANTNIAHFNTTASLENALFWVGNPQPYVAGVDPENQAALTIGSSTAWLFKSENVKLGFLAYSANELEPLEKRLDRLEQHMAILGARMLSADKKGVEAAETARIHRQGEVSVTAGVCGSISRAATDIVRVVCRWAGTPSEEAKVTMFTNFFDLQISLDDALKAVQLWQKGVISIDDLIALLKKGELVEPTRTVEQIVSANQSSPIQPIMPGLTENSVGTTPPGIDEPPAAPPRKKLTPKPPKPAE